MRSFCAVNSMLFLPKNAFSGVEYVPNEAPEAPPPGLFGSDDEEDEATRDAQDTDLNEHEHIVDETDELGESSGVPANEKPEWAAGEESE